MMSKGVRLIATLAATVWLMTLLTSCGGGASNGVGGTGITHARISNLGVDGVNDTMTVKGVQYKTDNTIFIRDGIPTNEQSDYSVGEIVTVEGSIDTDGRSGVASKVIFDDTLEGPVTKLVEVVSADIFRIEVLGQPVVINNKTILYGFDNLSDLRKSHIVEISGFIDEERGIIASTIKLLSTFTTPDSTIFEVEGRISNVNLTQQTFLLNNLIVDFSNVPLDSYDDTGLEDGFFVLVRSSFPLTDDDIFIATDIFVLGEGKLEPNTRHEIQVHITRLNSLADFDLDGNPAIIDSQTILTNTFTLRTGNAPESDFSLNKHVIARGFTNGEGVLFVDELILIPQASEIFVDGRIEVIDYENKTVSVLGITIRIKPITFITNEEFVQTDINDFSVGDFIFSEAYRDIANSTDGNYIALAFNKVGFDEQVHIDDTVIDSDERQGVITLFDHRIETSLETKYFNVLSQPISKQEFFSTLTQETSYINLSGVQIDGAAILAQRIQIDVVDQ